MELSLPLDVVGVVVSSVTGVHTFRDVTRLNQGHHVLRLFRALQLDPSNHAMRNFLVSYCRALLELDFWRLL